MIPETNGTMAVIEIPGGAKYYEKVVPVVAWDDDGHALVADDSSGRLVRAADELGFMELRNDPKAVAMIPGGGWSVSLGHGEPDLPVVAWALRADGRVRPLVAFGVDGAEPAEDIAPIRGIYPPSADLSSTLAGR